MGKNNFESTLRRIFWPIESYENKKFIPMALMMSCILFNSSALRSIKDGLVVSHIGAESVSFIKTYCVLPFAILMMTIYSKMCNNMSQKNIFYSIVTFFIIFFALFTFVLYPYPHVFHFSADKIESLTSEYHHLQWFIKIIGNWSYVLFYIMAEMWTSIVLSLLFWQFANQIVKTEEAKRFYSMFGLIGNLSLPLVAVTFSILLGENSIKIVSSNIKMLPVLCITIAVSMMVLVLYYWINDNVLTDPALYSEASSSTKKKKSKPSIKESLKMILSSKYLGLVLMLILSYNISINLVEGIWKSKIRELYSTPESYTSFMGMFQAYQGIVAIAFMIVGSNILRSFSWTISALITPIMILITGIAFFSFIIFDQTIGLYIAAFLGTGPLALAVLFGMIQNILSKATKYSLFDATKEMSYIPLDNELKTKGKAAVDVIGSRFGKGAGGVIQSTVFLLIPSYTFAEATPFFASIFFIIVIIWIFAAKALGVEYQKKISS